MKKHPSEPPPPHHAPRTMPEDVTVFPGSAPAPSAAVVRGDADIADLKQQIAVIEAELAIFRRRLGVRRS
jgi:hypothetical protein